MEHFICTHTNNFHHPFGIICHSCFLIIPFEFYDRRTFHPVSHHPPISHISVYLPWLGWDIFPRHVELDLELVWWAPTKTSVVSRVGLFRSPPFRGTRTFKFGLFLSIHDSGNNIYSKRDHSCTWLLPLASSSFSFESKCLDSMCGWKKDED